MILLFIDILHAINVELLNRGELIQTFKMDEHEKV